MTDPRNHVRPGQPLSLAAEQVNWINEQMRGNPGFGGGPLTLPQAPFTSLPCRNDTAQVIPRWSGVAISLAITPNANGTAGTPQFERTPILAGSALAASTTSWGVAIEPIKPGEIGPLAVAGAVPCRLRIADAAHSEVIPEANGLRTYPLGSARILWKEAGTGFDKWALVLLGAGDAMVTAIIQWTGSWPAGTNKTVRLAGTTEDITARNEFAAIWGSCGQRLGAAIRYRGTWYLVATQFN
jgi:hypothetical protein